MNTLQKESKELQQGRFETCWGAKNHNLVLRTKRPHAKWNTCVKWIFYPNLLVLNIFLRQVAGISMKSFYLSAILKPLPNYRL